MTANQIAAAGSKASTAPIKLTSTRILSGYFDAAQESAKKHIPLNCQNPAKLMELVFSDIENFPLGDNVSRIKATAFAISAINLEMTRFANMH